MSIARLIGERILRLPTQGGLLLIGAYKVLISPVFYTLGVRCRHEPTCSSYGADAISSQGLWRGIWLTLGRILRCRPGGTWGHDPAPAVANGSPWWKVWALRDPVDKPSGDDESR